MTLHDIIINLKVKPWARERWKPIPNNINYYASNMGRICSKRKLLKLTKSGDKKYLVVNLGKNNHYYVHRLIAKTFIKNLSNKPCVNHLDGNRYNNKLVNLKWCTYSENELHSYNILHKQPYALGKLGIEANKAKQVALIDTNNNYIKVFGSAAEAERKLFGKVSNVISPVCRGTKTSIHKLKFIYIPKVKYFEYIEFNNKVKEL